MGDSELSGALGKPAVSLAMPLWDPSVMRVLAFEIGDRDGAEGVGPLIIAVARVDLVTNPALGCGVGRLMSAGREPGAGLRSRPFSGPRLENAIWRPSPPDVLVAACGEARSAVPDDLRRGLPWIIVLNAWERLLRVVPSELTPACWDHLADDSTPMPGRNALEREAWLLAQMLYRLLHLAPPDELVALSRDPLT